jgi:hypothetical protein
MQFYLGTHIPSWLKCIDVPLFVSHQRLRHLKTLPRALGTWALDSGGFTEIAQHGTWTITPQAYITAVRRYQDEIGRMEWAAPQDWMCEPDMLHKTGKTIYAHQVLTIANYLTLMDSAPDLPFVPVLQGWSEPDYLRHVEMYARAGVDLTTYDTVGIGTVCRRQGTHEAIQIINSLTGLGIKLHGFGFKLTGLKQAAHLLHSADSMAWSYAGRRTPDPTGRRKNLANCQQYAMQWRTRVLDAIERGETNTWQHRMLLTSPDTAA